MHLLPEIEPNHLVPLTWTDWVRALKSAKSTSMRGTDCWSIPELKRLPRSVVEVLLGIFHHIEQGSRWPGQLTHWKLIVLRKSNVSDIDWTLLRPISVAGMLYRIWARMRTKQFLAHCSTLKTSLVSPSLSTRGVWCFLADKLDSTYTQGQRLCGVVIDIIKCFNAVHRRTLYKAMVRLGFCPNVLRAWFQALKQLVRSVLIEGFSYGHASSCTGIPEGDPLSVAAMFCLSFWFSRFTGNCSPTAIPACYADNWESVFPHVDQLILYLPQLEEFLDAFRLPVNPAKCWTWSLDPSQRKLLRQVVWCGSRLPVKLQARELGADVSYAFGRQRESETAGFKPHTKGS